MYKKFVYGEAHTALVPPADQLHPCRVAASPPFASDAKKAAMPLITSMSSIPNVRGLANKGLLSVAARELGGGGELGGGAGEDGNGI